MSDERYERGRERFLEVHDEKALATVEGLGDLGRAIVEFAYGDVYSRPGLTLRDREIAAVAALVATGRSSQIPQHLRASLKAGLTPDELREIILQTATIAGFPPAMNAMSTLKTVLGPETADPSDVSRDGPAPPSTGSGTRSYSRTLPHGTWIFFRWMSAPRCSRRSTTRRSAVHGTGVEPIGADTISVSPASEPSSSQARTSACVISSGSPSGCTTSRDVADHPVPRDDGPPVQHDPPLGRLERVRRHVLDGDAPSRLGEMDAVDVVFACTHDGSRLSPERAAGIGQKTHVGPRSDGRPVSPRRLVEPEDGVRQEVHGPEVPRGGHGAEADQIELVDDLAAPGVQLEDRVVPGHPVRVADDDAAEQGAVDRKRSRTFPVRRSTRRTLSSKELETQRRFPPIARPSGS